MSRYLSSILFLIFLLLISDTDIYAYTSNQTPNQEVDKGTNQTSYKTTNQTSYKTTNQTLNKTFNQILFNSPNESLYNLATNDDSTYSDILKNFFTGLFNNNSDSACVQTVVKNRDKFDEVIDNMIDFQGDFQDLLKKYGFQLIKIKGFLKNCQMAFLFQIYFQLVNATKLKKVGDRIINQSKKIENILNNQPEDNLVNKLGSLTKLVFNLTFREEKQK